MLSQTGTLTVNVLIHYKTNKTIWLLETGIYALKKKLSVILMIFKGITNFLIF